MVKKVLIAGATGFLGMSLARRLLSQDVYVVGIGRNRLKLEELSHYKNFVGIELEFRQYCDIDRYLPVNEFDVVYYFSWSGGFLPEALRDYKLQVHNIIAACDFLKGIEKINFKKLVYSGTVNETEIHQYLNYSDNFSPRGTCIYASSKLTAEMMLKTMISPRNIDYCVGVVPMVYGEGNLSKQLFNVVVDCLIRGISPKLTTGDNLYDLVYVEDISGGFQAIGESGKNGKRYYIGHRKLQTFREWIEEIRDLIAPNVGLTFGEYQDPLNLDYSLLNLDLLYFDSSYECECDFKMTLKKTVQWYESKVFGGEPE